MAKLTISLVIIGILAANIGNAAVESFTDSKIAHHRMLDDI